jgi:hypothetical protein
MDKRLENALDFLLFSYFSFTLKTHKENEDIVVDTPYTEILDKVIDRAYLDAARTIEIPKLDNLRTDKGKGDFLRIKIKDLLTEEIKKLKNESNYNTWHEKTCKALNAIDTELSKIDKVSQSYPEISITNYYGKKIEITCGQAQKIVNMTMKYLYILNTIFSEYSYTDENENNFCKWYEKYIAKFSSELHVPLDSYIFDAAKNDKIAPPNCSWSKLTDYAEYANYQDKIKENHNNPPIDWESPAWIKQAKEKNKNTQNKKLAQIDKRIEAKK